MVIIGGFSIFAFGRKGIAKLWNRHKEKYE
jgi:hypothetical protein